MDNREASLADHPPVCTCAECVRMKREGYRRHTADGSWVKDSVKRTSPFDPQRVSRYKGESDGVIHTSNYSELGVGDEKRVIGRSWLLRVVVNGLALILMLLGLAFLVWFFLSGGD